MSVDSEKVEAGGLSKHLKLIFRLLPVLLFAGLAGAFTISLLSGPANILPSALINKSIPQFTLPSLGDDENVTSTLPGLKTEDLIQGKVTVVNYFASWCPPCRYEHPVLMRLNRMNIVKLVGISQKDDPVKSMNFLNELGNPYSAVGVDRNGRVSIDWGVYGLPETFIVDGEGKIRFKYVGPISNQFLDAKIIPEIKKARRPISG
jgi:cytochrome c biogenesis protein CcmG, thiol:disulfide interchange protein DsbE